ncbi:MAG: rhodanese-like domain-containing protein [Lachnospiraceae bacterium]|uniref:Rhodanese-like domain-containing protein n=1 Tax=Candidatus Weimeria bifida TaxID=2599074 RepID=A0A6N7IYY4_9FIRM|nr:rhodanese-like domain-containing protein [Candidatus Weimeria bifida]RRF97101.1 MAG: rhodanese-like domain-containing protein [Lachnospiraceae bacterium]
MSIFSRNRTKEITLNQAINITRTTTKTALVDIRDKEVFKKDHVPDAINIPLNNIKVVHNRIPDTDTTLYIYGDYETRPKKSIKAFRNEGYNNLVRAGCLEDHYIREYR